MSGKKRRERGEDGGDERGRELSNYHVQSREDKGAQPMDVEGT